MTLKVGDKVTINNTTLSGVVDGATLDSTTLQIQYLVSYNDFNNEPQQRYFDAQQITVA